jgi:N-acetylglucosamine-6-sulfatase
MRTSLLHLRPTIDAVTPPRTFLCLVLALLALGVLAAPAAGQTPPPNIVLILTDDQRWDTLSAMPTVRRELVEKGVNFANGFVVNSLCCPSRASILTGQYSHSTGVYTNTGNRGLWAFREHETVAPVLQGAGYMTAYVGKYLNGYGGTRIPPGWNHWVAFSGVGYYQYGLNVNGALTSPAPGDYSTDVLAGHAVSVIEQAPGPFFLTFAPYAPHLPANPAPRHENAFPRLEAWRPPSYNEDDVSDKPDWVRTLPSMSPGQQRELDEFRRDQLRSLLAVDEGVARILEALERTGRLQNTLIVFTSDNGYAWGEHRRSTKMDPYEESIRVPFVLRYDALALPPREERQLALNIDLAPTFAHLAGTFLPLADGQSLLPLLTTPTVPWRSDFLIEHLRASATARMPTYCGVRTKSSLYVSYETGEEELYDLVADPYELTNLAKNPAARPVLVSLRARLGQLCNPPPPTVCTMKGTKRPDVLYGTPGYEVVCAYHGDDLVSVAAGNDVVLAGWGHDDVYGRAGNDRLYGGPGYDWLFGGPGNDTIYAKDGQRDLLTCWTGRDTVIADRRDRIGPGCERIRRS